MDVSTLAHDYGQRLPAWQDLARRMQTLLVEQLADLKPTVLGRIKRLESGVEKMSRRSSQSLDDVVDWVGLRVMVPAPHHLLIAYERLRTIFDVEESYAATSFTDERIHLHLSIGKTRSALTEWQHLRHLHAEVQLVTIRAASELERQHIELYRRGHILRNNTPESFVADLRRCIADFENLLNHNDVHEKQHIHPFIANNPFLLHPNPDEFFSEVAIGLGTEFRMDFLLRLPDSSYLLVEIENPRHRLFTTSGDFSAPVNHAVRQVEDWQDWIETNLLVVEKKYPGMVAPFGQVVIGRSHDLDEQQLRRLRRRNINTRGRLVVSTYDDLITQARTYVARLATRMNVL